MFLTPSDLEQLTERRMPAAQARWLDARGWHYERGANGGVKVLRSYAEAMMGQATPKVAAPNFGAIGG